MIWPPAFESLQLILTRADKLLNASKLQICEQNEYCCFKSLQFEMVYYYIAIEPGTMLPPKLKYCENFKEKHRWKICIFKILQTFTKCN